MTKIFTLDNYLQNDSSFKIGIEFENSDEGIKSLLKNHNSDQYLELDPFSGFVSIKVDNEEIGDPLTLTYPAQHLAWLKTYSKNFLQEETEQEKALIVTGLINNESGNEHYKCSHRHLFQSPDEELPFLYRTQEGILKIEGFRTQGKQFNFSLNKDEFERYLNLRLDHFLTEMKRVFPEIKSPSFRYF